MSASCTLSTINSGQDIHVRTGNSPTVASSVSNGLLTIGNSIAVILFAMSSGKIYRTSCHSTGRGTHDIHTLMSSCRAWLQ